MHKEITAQFLNDHGACAGGQKLISGLIPVIVYDSTYANSPLAHRIQALYTEVGVKRCLACDLAWLIDTTRGNKYNSNQVHVYLGIDGNTNWDVVAEETASVGPHRIAALLSYVGGAEEVVGLDPGSTL